MTEIDNIIQSVTPFYGLTPADILQKTRKRPVPEAKMVIAVLAYCKHRMSSNVVSRLLGYKNHSSVLHAQRTVLNGITYNSEFREKMIGVAACPTCELRAMLTAPRWD